MCNVVVCAKYSRRRRLDRHAILKVLNTNFRSLNKPQTRDEFHALLNQMNPDIVVGSETWPRGYKTGVHSQTQNKAQ